MLKSREPYTAFALEHRWTSFTPHRSCTSYGHLQTMFCRINTLLERELDHLIVKMCHPADVAVMVVS